MNIKNPKIAMGKKSRAQGIAFERRVRQDLESKGWIVDKWTNNVELTIEKKPELVGVRNPKSKKDFNILGKLVSAKSKWAGPGRPMMMGAGFPDFIAFQRRGCSLCYGRMGIESEENYNVIGVESKMTGKLDKEEKNKCDWLLKKNIFSKILIASKTKVKNKIVVEYTEYE